MRPRHVINLPAAFLGSLDQGTASFEQQPLDGSDDFRIKLLEVTVRIEYPLSPSWRASDDLVNVVVQPVGFGTRH